MKLQERVQRYIKKNYPTAYLVNVITAGRSGVPDLLVCYKGKFVAIEVKDKRDKLSALQSLNIFRIIESGGIAGVVNNLENLDVLMNKVHDTVLQDSK